MYETGWTWVHWVLALLLLAGAIAALVKVPGLIVNAYEVYEYSRWRWPAMIGLLLVGLAGVVFAFGVPGALMRHQAEVSGSLWMVVVSALAAVLAAYWGAIEYPGRWAVYPGLIVGAGAFLGMLGDLVTRAAASFPMAVGSFLLGVTVIFCIGYFATKE